MVEKVEPGFKLEVFMWNQTEVFGDLDVGAMGNEAGIGLEKAVS